MVVTVSGTAGSGKSTAARHAAEVLGRRGYDVVLLRFQSLPCFTILRTTLRPEANSIPGADRLGAEASTAVRWSGYTRRRLGFFAALLYLTRIVAFRIYRVGWWPGGRVHVLNRYFYDSLAHYYLDSAVERFWLRVLYAAIPRPDIAIVIVADAHTLAARRPDYADEYLADAGTAYGKIRARFPELIELRNEGSLGEMIKRLERMLPAGRAGGRSS